MKNKFYLERNIKGIELERDERSKLDSKYKRKGKKKTIEKFRVK